MYLDVDIRHVLRSAERSFVLDVRFTLREELAVLYGPSGSGKSSTLHAIAGLLRPDAGRISLGDDVLFDAMAQIDVPARHRGMARPAAGRRAGQRPSRMSFPATFIMARPA